MKVEFNSNFINKVKKQLKNDEEISRRRSFRKRRISRNYFVLLGLMVLLIGANLSRNLKSDKIEESAAPVFSSIDDKQEESKKESNVKNNILDFSLPVSKEKILSYNYANGILNLQVEKNEDVFSMTDGVVENTYLDYSYGYTVVIKMNNNTICKYSNLDSNIKINIGDSIKKGDTIGKTLDYSLLNASYLYLSVIQNGENINFVELFDNIK